MELTDRIKVVMKVNNLSASQLADEIGVQRSNLSHILSGRNKPGFDFLHRLLERYPKVNAHWLITGKSQAAPTAESASSFTEEKPENPPESPSAKEEQPIVTKQDIERIVVFYRNGTFAEYKPKEAESD